MIFLECYNDEAVLRGLGVPKRNIEHEPGKSESSLFRVGIPAGTKGHELELLRVGFRRSRTEAGLCGMDCILFETP